MKIKTIDYTRQILHKIERIEGELFEVRIFSKENQFFDLKKYAKISTELSALKRMVVEYGELYVTLEEKYENLIRQTK